MHLETGGIQLRDCSFQQLGFYHRYAERSTAFEVRLKHCSGIVFQHTVLHDLDRRRPDVTVCVLLALRDQIRDLRLIFFPVPPQ